MIIYNWLEKLLHTQTISEASSLITPLTMSELVPVIMTETDCMLEQAHRVDSLLAPHNENSREPQTSVMAGIELFPAALPESVVSGIIQDVVSNNNAQPTEFTVTLSAQSHQVYRQNPALGQPGIMYAYVFLHADFDEVVDSEIKSQIMALAPQLLRLPSYESRTLEVSAVDN